MDGPNRLKQVDLQIEWIESNRNPIAVGMGSSGPQGLNHFSELFVSI